MLHLAILNGLDGDRAKKRAADTSVRGLMEPTIAMQISRRQDVLYPGPLFDVANWHPLQRLAETGGRHGAPAGRARRARAASASRGAWYRNTLPGCQILRHR
jgi:hypothetical protein